MRDDKFDMFRNRLAKNNKHLAKHAKRLKLSCYRVYDHDIPEFPFCIEFYGAYLYVAEYKRNHQFADWIYDDWLTESLQVIGEVLQVEQENIFTKLRQRKMGRQGQYQKLENSNQELIVEENGLKFIINLTDYLDTGLFLDHRVTREKVRHIAENKKLLNLFAYTGSFSVYAAAGNAAEVVTVDLSNTYLNWAKKNMQLNEFVNDAKFQFVQADVLQYLQEVASERFDIIVMDPPTFSNSKKMNDILDIQRDHVFLINQCLRIMKTGGVLYFSTNYRKFILENQKINSKKIKDITAQTISFDFVGKLSRNCFLIEK